uniref:Uncharacterized protein n=1 Tax=Spongospora subterranea TaxID=70186 RepID=A0A0H5QKF7_9EUKA|eukprot:CRZ02112.1 hypothetical protein [Spongospora subterranea]
MCIPKNTRNHSSTSSPTSYQYSRKSMNNTGQLFCPAHLQLGDNFCWRCPWSLPVVDPSLLSFSLTQDEGFVYGNFGLLKGDGGANKGKGIDWGTFIWLDEG